MKKKFMFLVLAVFLAGGCSGDKNSLTGPGNTQPLAFDFTFGTDSQGFTGGFAEYGQNMAEGMELTFERKALPQSLGNGSGLFLSGRNSSDDLFMFIKRRLGAEDGIKPRKVYEISLTVQIATSAASGCVGAGGAPGEAVTVKAGATAEEPKATLTDGFYTINIQKGQQGSGGPEAAVIGNIGNDSGDCSGATWEFKTLKLEDFNVQADAGGTIWLLAGTDSGYEGINRLYYTRLQVTLTETALDSLPSSK